MEPCPDNHRPDSAAYVCLIPVLDIWRLDEASLSRGDVWTYQQIDVAILDDVRARRALLVFDLSNEGTEFPVAAFDKFLAWIEQNRLPPGAVTWLCQNRKFAALARSHFGARADGLSFANSDFFVRHILWALSTYNASMTAALERYRASMENASLKDKTFLCLNATPRLHRVLTLAALKARGLFDQGLISHGGKRYQKASQDGSSVLAYVRGSEPLKALEPFVQDILDSDALKIDDFAEAGNQLFDKVDLGAYTRTFFSLVTETDFSNGTVDRVTEKLVKPFCLGHPALVIGNPHCVRHLVDLGFQDWTGVLDRSSESLISATDRWLAVLDETQRQCAAIAAAKPQWLEATRDVSAYNFEFARSGRAFDAYVAKYDEPLVRTFARWLGVD